MKSDFFALLVVIIEDASGVVHSQAGETYFDGSIEQDIPVAGLAEMVSLHLAKTVEWPETTTLTSYFLLVQLPVLHCVSMQSPCGSIFL